MEKVEGLEGVVGRAAAVGDVEEGVKGERDWEGEAKGAWGEAREVGTVAKDWVATATVGVAGVAGVASRRCIPSA